MSSSPFQLAANRANARKSTGPKTLDGKARSRRNSFKHGLTGEGVALPREDADEVQGRLDDLEAELKPGSVLARILVQRVALFSVRLERCARHETVHLSRRIRAAEGEFVEARKAEADRLYAGIKLDPPGAIRALKRTPEGIERLIGGWLELRGDLVREQGGFWSGYHSDRAENLSGRWCSDYRMTRYRALDAGLSDDPQWLDPADLKHGDLKSHCLAELARMLDEELAGLRKEFAALDLTDLEKDRAEAADRALFDPSKEAILARRYEAAAERGMYKALDRIEEIRDTVVGDIPWASEEAEVPGPAEPGPPIEESSPTIPPSFSRGSLASFFPSPTMVEAGSRTSRIPVEMDHGSRRFGAEIVPDRAFEAAGRGA